VTSLSQAGFAPDSAFHTHVELQGVHAEKVCLDLYSMKRVDRVMSTRLSNNGFDAMFFDPTGLLQAVFLA
jgi:hypothetical protein